MRVDVIKIVILAFLIIISIGVLSYIKSQKKKLQKVIFEGFDVNAPMPRDFDNKTLEDSQLYGSIPQGATISIFHKAELKGLTANPDSIPIANGDKQGRGGGPQLEVTSIPPQPIPPDDIEAKLNAAADEEPVPFELDTTITEGFVTAAEANDAAIKAKALADEARALGQDPKAYAQAKAEAAIKAQALKMGYTGPMSKDELEAIATAKATQVANAALAKAGVKLPPLPKYDTSTTKGMIMQKAQDFLIAQAKSRLKDAVMNQLKSAKVAKLAGKLVAQAKALVLKGVKKVTEKIAGMFAKKLGAKIGAKATEGIFKKLAAKLVEKVTAAVAKAQSTAAGLASNPFTVAIGIMLSVISAVAMVVGISLPIILKGDEGVCEPGWKKVSEVWPSFLDNIPGVGDIMGVIAPYLCYLDACDPNEQEDAGLCYPKCDKGYDGVGPVCWNHATETEPKGPGVPKGCPDGWQDDGALICKERSGRICGDDCSKGWDNCRRRGALGECWGGCREGCSDVYLGRWIGKMNNAKDGGNLLKCSGDREEVDFLTGQAPTDISVLPLCYGKCPLVGKPVGTVTTTKYPVYIKKRPSPNADAAQKALMDALAIKTTSAETLKALQKGVGDAIAKDAVLPIPADAPYIRNPDGPRIGSETAAVMPPRRWPLQETQYYTDLLAGIENGRVVFYSEALGGWQTFESIYGGYGITFMTGNVKVKKISMTSVGPQVITEKDGTVYKWAPKIMDWEWNGWGIFKDLAASNNDFTQLMGTNDRPYVWRWKNNRRGIGEGGGQNGDWYGMLGIAANDTGDAGHDHGNMYSTNSVGFHANIIDWDRRYLLGNDITFDPAGLHDHKATDIGVTQDVVKPKDKNFAYYISTNKGSIYRSEGPDRADVERTRQKIDGPLPGKPITAITISTGFPTPIVYVISGGRLFKGKTRIVKKTIMPGWNIDQHILDWTEIPGKTLTDIAIGPPVLNEQYTAYQNYTTYLQTMQSQVYSKYPIPSPTTPEDKIPELTETITSKSEERMKHIPLLPYLCMGNRGLAYGRGVGKPKLKLKMVTKTPPPPPPPGPTNSAAYADDPDTPCSVEFSDVKVLQDMCDFYYHAAVTNANVNADGSVSFGYITKITKVMGSSEQSADITCDITNIVVNTDTGKTLSTTVAVGSERRIYFAKIEKVCSFVVVGATNANGTAPDAKDPNAKVVNFTPVIQKCVDVPIGLKKCQGQDSIDAMIAMYKKTLPPTVRIKSIDAVQDSGTDVCAVAWKEVTYDPATNVESAPTVKVGNFKYTQDKSNDACAYKLQSYSAGDPSASVKSLAKPVTYDTPLPPEVTLQGCSTTCKDPLMVQKLVAAFNNQPGSNRILAVDKVVTPSPLRCDIEADVYIGQTKATEKQKIRFDLKKDQASCVFSVATVGAAGTGSFIQSNTAALGTAISTKDTIMALSLIHI